MSQKQLRPFSLYTYAKLQHIDYDKSSQYNLVLIVDLSFVIPVKNEEESIVKLSQEIEAVCKKIKKTYEIIFIDDGSSDNSYLIIKKLARKNKKISGIKLRANLGKAIALSAGFENAKGKIIFTMDGDLQDNPVEIPNFIKKINEGYDLVCGWKQKRYDPISKTLPSKVINTTVRILTGLKLHDINCGFKAYKPNVIKNLRIYGDLFRFIPVLAQRYGFKITEVPVKHRERRFGKSKYGWKRFFIGFLDLLTVFFLARYLKRPGHFFGVIGSLLFSCGTLIGLYITYLRLTTGSIQYRFPLLFLGVMLIILGIQFVMTGLLAEMIIYFNDREKVSESIVEKI